VEFSWICEAKSACGRLKRKNASTSHREEAKPRYVLPSEGRGRGREEGEKRERRGRGTRKGDRARQQHRGEKGGEGKGLGRNIKGSMFHNKRAR